MKCFLMLDLVGTLIEFNHVINREQPRNKYMESVADEYQSRINYIGRKLNEFMQSGNIVTIASSQDHCSTHHIATVLSDIDKVILDENKDKIYYFISEARTNETYLAESGKEIYLVEDKIKAYYTISSKYPEYYPIAIDDGPTHNDIFYKILSQGGQVGYILNDYNNRELYPKNFQRLAYRIFHLDDTLDGMITWNNSLEENSKLSLEGYEILPFTNYYEQMHNHTLNAAEVYNWNKKRKLIAYLKKHGFSDDEIFDLFKHNCISMEPSFEKAFQKIIKPKL